MKPAPTNDRPRCPWAKKDAAYIAYHDEEWGVPLHNDRALFEFLILEGAQAGLSWLTILKKRDNYRVAFDNFDMERIARYNAKKLASLQTDAGIVRNRLKIASAVLNAQAALKARSDFGSLDAYFWRFVDGRPIQNHWRTADAIPARTALSDALSKDLLSRGFKFVGSTIMYAFMQATGMVDDHLETCFRRTETSERVILSK